MTLKVHWVDANRTARSKPDPRYPIGVDLDFSKGRVKVCTAPLPYPAPRCGCWLIKCDVCDQTVVITAAGRIDDPRSIKLACKLS